MNKNIGKKKREDTRGIMKRRYAWLHEESRRKAVDKENQED
jgi:hypothetical protein